MIAIKKYLIIATAALYAACWSCGHDDHDHDHDHDRDHEAEHAEDADHDGHDGHDADEIILEPEMAQRMGVQVQAVAPGEFSDVIVVSGQIMPAPADNAVASAPVAGRLTLNHALVPGMTVSAGQSLGSISAAAISGGNADAAARTALEAARRELERARPLHQQGIVSDKDFAALQAQYDAAAALYSPSAQSGAVTAPIAGVVTEVLAAQGQVVEVGQPIARITSARRLTLRADLPQQYAAMLPSLTGANIRPQGATEAIPLAGHGLQRTSATAASASAGYIPVTFTFNNPGGIVPGSMVEVYLLGTPRQGVITVPVGAITEQMGEKYVYTRIDDHGYRRHLVHLGGSDGSRVEVLDGLSAGDNVVAAGATVVRLAENSGKVPEGHSHNH